MVAGPEQIAEQFAAARNERNAAELAALFADDADFVNVVGLWWGNREDIRRAHDYGLRTFFRDAACSLPRTKMQRLGRTCPMFAKGSWCSWWSVAAPDGSR